LATGQEDKVTIAILKLTDVARAFYNGTSELHDPDDMDGV
jgi:hypothetical protein